ncbi:MAG: cupredoxin family copper-binding protein [Gemmatimonadetes bacterium]|nr:cupredoxin family copper-binding protein [Gemmatimonadota bacterium]
MRRVIPILLVAAVSPPVVAAAGQSLLERSPNIAGAWVAPAGRLQFNFLHRFQVGSAPTRKVTNYPTFLLGAGVGSSLMVGANYATNSDVAERYPNEWEFFGRWAPWSTDAGAPVAAAVQAGYNLAAQSVDGALVLARGFGPVRLQAEGRVLGHAYDRAETRVVAAGGAVVRLGRWFALGADLGVPVNAGDTVRAAWGAGLQFALPYTPHTLSLQVTNTNSATLEGASRGGRQRRYGFEFTVPITLGRFFGRTATAAAPPAPGAAAVDPALTATPAAAAKAAPADSGVAVAAAPTPAPTAPSADTARRAPAPDRAAPTRLARRAGAVSRATISNLAFGPARLQVAAGTTIVWTNRDPVPHSVTADDGSFDSGVIEPGKTWRHTFTRPGTYNFHCTPHPFMKGVVVVR